MGGYEGQASRQVGAQKGAQKGLAKGLAKGCAKGLAKGFAEGFVLTSPLLRSNCAVSGLSQWENMRTGHRFKCSG